jgi:hypothetical protein
MQTNPKYNAEYIDNNIKNKWLFKLLEKEWTTNDHNKNITRGLQT